MRDNEAAYPVAVATKVSPEIFEALQKIAEKEDSSIARICRRFIVNGVSSAGVQS